jgi:hypothetical protein
VEYASQFDVLLPGFAAMKLPILLGGSSNHFVGLLAQMHQEYSSFTTL